VANSSDVEAVGPLQLEGFHDPVQACAKWLGREDSNLESGLERCGTESGRPSVASSLIG
jgi:hypothetical protein